MKISIVIPCYNQCHWLVTAIHSVVFQINSIKKEIIIVNDGSTDDFIQNSDWILKTFSNIDIKIINQENKGLSAARNAGIKAANGEFILPLDADDKIHEDFISKCLFNNSDIIATARQEFGNSTKQWLPKEFPTHQDFLKANQMDYCALYKKNIWEELGGYDENMKDGFEDWDFWIRATAAGYKVQVIQELLFYYRKHGESLLTHALKNKKKIFFLELQ